MLFARLLMVSMSAQVYAEAPASLTQSPTQTVTVLQEQTAKTETPTLKDVRIASENGQQRIIKTWETAPSYDADQLVEPDFQKSGYNFKKSYLLMVSENQSKQSKLASQTVTVSHTQKGGATLQLSDVDWTAMGEGSYRALASYRGTATGVDVSGYTSTATYLGEVKKDTLESVTYAVVYEGSPIPLPPPDYFTNLLIGVGVIVVVGDAKPKTPSPAVISLTPETIWQEDATVTYNAFTLPEKAAFSEGGNIGVLSIPSLGLAVNFNGTDGYFKNLHTLKAGDALAYETALGSREYTATAVKMIDQNDWSGLARDTENRLMVEAVQK